MIDASLSTNEFVKLRAHPDLSVPCSTWDGYLSGTLERLKKCEVNFNTQGTNASAERWCVNLLLTSTAKKILQESSIEFSIHSWI